MILCYDLFVCCAEVTHHGIQRNSLGPVSPDRHIPAKVFCFHPRISVIIYFNIFWAFSLLKSSFLLALPAWSQDLGYVSPIRPPVHHRTISIRRSDSQFWVHFCHGGCPDHPLSQTLPYAIFHTNIPPCIHILSVPQMGSTVFIETAFIFPITWKSFSNI